MCFDNKTAFLARVLAVVLSAACMAGATAAECEPRVAILVYHRFAATADDAMTVRISTFEAQLQFLREHGYRIVPLRNVVDWAANASPDMLDKSVALTVDEGHRSVYEALRPIVIRERLPVTLFIYPSATT